YRERMTVALWLSPMPRRITVALWLTVSAWRMMTMSGFLSGWDDGGHDLGRGCKTACTGLQVARLQGSAGREGDPLVEEGLEVGLPGPLEARLGGVPVPLGGRRQRAVLALLLLEPNRVVSTDRLIDGVWGARPPSAAEATLQGYLSRLRKALGAELV